MAFPFRASACNENHELAVFFKSPRAREASKITKFINR